MGTAGAWWLIWRWSTCRRRAPARTWWWISASLKLRALTERLDHHFIVEEGSLAPDTLACLEREGFALFIVPFRTTAENLAKWFFDALAARGLPVAQVEVYETPNNCAYYREQR